MKPTTIQLAGKDVEVRESARPLKNELGYYWSGGDDDREIVLSKGLSEREKLRVFIHEAFHGLFYYLDETVVDRASHELTDALDELDLI